MADTIDDIIFRYIDRAVAQQGEQTRLIVAPVVRRVEHLELIVDGDGNGRLSLSERLRTHVHPGMLRVDRKTLVAICSIAASVAAVVGFFVQVLRG